MPLDLFSQEEIKPQRKPLDLFGQKELAIEPEPITQIPLRSSAGIPTGHLSPEMQRMMQPTMGSTAVAEYLESFIKGATFGAFEPEITSFEEGMEKPGWFEGAKKVSEFMGYGAGMAPIVKMTTAPIQGAIQSYNVLRGASPALKTAIHGVVTGGLVGATEAATQGKPLKVGAIDTATTSLLFGLFSAGPTKFIDWFTKKGVEPQEAQRLYTSIENIKKNLAQTRVGTISSNFENYVDREAGVLGKKISQFGPIQTAKQYKQIQAELQKVFDVIPPERVQVAQERTSELFRLAKQAITPKPKESLHRPWLNILKDFNIALGKRGAMGAIKITKDQYSARQRLAKDITIIMRNAAKTGKTIEKYLTDLGYDKVIARELQEMAQMKVETGISLGKRISDEVKQYVDLSNMAMKKGKSEIAERMASKAIQNGQTIKLADGPEVENIINQQLNNLPNYPKEKLPKYAGSINLERQAISMSAKEVELQLSKQVPKSRQTWTETQKEAQRIVGDQKKFQALMKRASRGQGVKPQEIDALRQVEVNAIEQLAKISESPQREALLKEFQDGIFLTTSKAATTAGRTLNIHKRVMAPNKIASAFSQLKRKLTDREWQRFNEANKTFAEGNPKPLLEFSDYIKATKKDPKVMDYVYEYWYNSILSGIPTHLVNTGSNTLWQLFQGTVHRPLLAIIDPVMARLQGRQREYFVSEIIPMWSGMARGFRRGAKAAKEVVKKGYTLEEGATKWDIETSQVMGAWERSPNPTIRKLAPFVSAFGRGLRAMDVWAKSIAFDGQIRALATRKAAQQGLKGEALIKRAKEYATAPTDIMIEDAAKYADYATFMDAPGEATRLVLGLRNALPGGRFVIPFVNTIANLMKRGAEMTPGLGLAIKGGRQGIKEGGAALTEVVTKQIEGLMIGATIAGLYSDEQVTGPVPRNRAEREAFYRAKKQPWSIKINDTWYSYRRIEPFNTVIGSVAILMENWKDTGEEPTSEKIVEVGTGIARNLLDGSYLQGLNGLLGAIEQGETNPQRLINVIERTGAGFVPYSSLQRSLVRATEALDEEKAIVRTPEGFVDILKSQTPGLSKEVRARKTLWGEPIELEGGPLRQFLPWKAQKEAPDFVDKEIYRLGKAGFMPFPGMPSKKVEGIELTPEQYDKYLVFSGQMAKKALDKLVKSPLYKNASDKSKAKLITNIIGKSRQRQKFIKLYLMKDNEKQRRKVIDLFSEEK